MKKAVRINVKGSVHGVFFREFVKENADLLNLKGIVRNLPDGDLEVRAEGDIEKIDELCELCKKGPKHAQIREVIIEETSFQDFKDFKILHI